MMAHNNIKKTICQLLIFVFGFYLVISLSREWFNLMKKGEKIGKMKGKAEELRIKNEKLKERLEYVKSEEFVEKEARDKLNMAKEDEVIVVLPEKLEVRGQRLGASSDEDLSNWQKWLRLFF